MNQLPTGAVPSLSQPDIKHLPVSKFSIEPLARKGVILGYSEYNVGQIREGIRRLAAAMRSV